MFVSVIGGTEVIGLLSCVVLYQLAKRSKGIMADALDEADHIDTPEGGAAELFEDVGEFEDVGGGGGTDGSGGGE